MKTAALIVIGDEILTGKVKDENTFVFAKTMFEQGVKVDRVCVIPDDIETIATIAKDYSQRFDYICTSGGVGPTHDDKTFDGVAQAFALPLKKHQEAFDFFANSQEEAGRGASVSEAQKKMLFFPEPCKVFFLKPLWLPLVQVENVYVFPGVPFLFEKLMHGFSHLFVGGKFYRRSIYTDLSESQIAFALKQIQDQEPAVQIGSYPQMPGKGYNVMVSVEGCDERSVNDVCEKILPLVSGRTDA